MKISYRWLQQYIPLDQSPEVVSEILTSIGLEVEGQEEVFAVPGGLENIVVAGVAECYQHPDADRLSVCQVRTSDNEVRQIVCGAPNVAAGQKVLVALPGAMIYADIDNPFEIKKGKIRGQESNGMICAEDELGLGDNHDGIMVLDPSAVIGTPAADYFGMETDYVYDIGLTPNRSDATSHIGVARDLLAYLQVHQGVEASLQWPISSMTAPETPNPVQVVVSDSEACPVYAGAVLRGVTVGPSPEWIQSRLRSIGVRSINNVVDITNYILHEYGQPLHAFDLDAVGDSGIRVQFLDSDTPFVTLDEKEIKLRAQDLMICDGQNRPLCMAGVFGGAHSGVTEATCNIFLESAHFDPKTIRQSSMYHHLRTDAAMVYEKGSDPSLVMPALERACELLVEHANATLDGAPKLYVNEPKAMPEIHLRWNAVSETLGVKIPQDTLRSILKTLEFEILGDTEEGLRIRASSCRADVLREIDVIEEILRIFGFNQVSVSGKAHYTLIPRDGRPLHRRRSDLANTLASWGYHEIMGLSLVSQNFVVETGESPVQINNTSNRNLEHLRNSLLISGIESVRYNLNRNNKNLKLYEFGKEYWSTAKGPRERELLSLIQTGHSPANWLQKQEPMDYYSLKSDVLQILGRLGVTNYQISDPDLGTFQYGVKIHQGPQELATFGLIHQDHLRRLGIDQAVYGGYIALETLWHRKSTEIKLSEPSKYPGTTRDLALLMGQSVTFGEIAAVCAKVAKKLLEKTELFDLYVDAEMEAAQQKSYAIRMHFSHPEKTLKDKEVDKVVQKIASTLDQKLGAKIR